MPFKVVQTVEKGKPVLTAVPHGWEKDGTLYWPKNQADKLIKVEDLNPEDNWIPIPCEVKRDNLSNYDEAQGEINSILYRYVSGQNQNNRNTSVVEPSTSSNVLKLELSSQDPLVYDEQAPVALSAGMELILENQRIMMENQRKMMRKINELANTLNNLTSRSNTVPLEFNEDIAFTTIDSQQALDDLENDLKDPEKRNALHKKYSVICQGKDLGVNSAYFLIDMIFTRKFMTKCSWAGGSRGEEAKIPFKTYNNVINFFHRLVYDCDKTFSIAECHNFLKIILKNSIKRSESKGLRSSHRKRRKHISALASFSHDNDGVDDYDESGDYIELEMNTETLSKKRRNIEVDTSDGESEVEKELNESDGYVREVKK